MLTTAVMSIPFAAIVAVFCLQFYLVKTQSLSPWALGSFGMFSTATQLYEGRFQIWLVGVEQDAQSEELITDFTSLTLLKQKAEVLPSSNNIQELGLAVCRLNTPKRPFGVRVDYWTSSYKRSEARLALAKSSEFLVPC